MYIKHCRECVKETPGALFVITVKGAKVLIKEFTIHNTKLLQIMRCEVIEKV